jgi:GT2 family glycosyltransferase
MAFRRTVFEQVGLFDIALGRKGKVLAGGEEWDLFRRILGAGGTVMYFPDARVHHKIEPYRLQKSYFRRWRYQASRNLAQTEEVPGSRRLIGIPMYLFPQFLRAVANAVKARFVASNDDAFRQEMIVWHFLGLMAGVRERWVRPPGASGSVDKG